MCPAQRRIRQLSPGQTEATTQPQMPVACGGGATSPVHMSHSAPRWLRLLPAPSCFEIPGPPRPMAPVLGAEGTEQEGSEATGSSKTSPGRGKPRFCCDPRAGTSRVARAIARGTGRRYAGHGMSRGGRGRCATPSGAGLRNRDPTGRRPPTWRHRRSPATPTPPAGCPGRPSVCGFHCHALGGLRIGNPGRLDAEGSVWRSDRHLPRVAQRPQHSPQPLPAQWCEWLRSPPFVRPPLWGRGDKAAGCPEVGAQ